jgi:succinate dehydrogenase / fumarate reductase cytochrome b subunit
MLNRPRPLSPFLHYRWQYTNTLSLLHRLTGIALSLSFLLLVYWVIATASGPAAYARATVLFSYPLMQGLLALVLIAFAYHFCNGIRHLVWDAGFGLERRQARRSAWIVLLATILVSVVVAGLVLFGGRGP